MIAENNEVFREVGESLTELNASRAENERLKEELKRYKQ